MVIAARRLIVLAIACISLAVLVGCESDTDRFRHQLHPLQEQALQQRAQIAATLRAVHVHSRSDAAQLNRQIDGLAATYSKMGKITAPDESRTVYTRYHAANMAIVVTLHQFADALVTGTRSQLSAASQRAQEAVGAAQRATDRLDSTLK